MGQNFWQQCFHFLFILCDIPRISVVCNDHNSVICNIRTFPVIVVVWVSCKLITWHFLIRDMEEINNIHSILLTSDTLTLLNFIQQIIKKECASSSPYYNAISTLSIFFMTKYYHDALLWNTNIFHGSQNLLQ